MNADFDCLASMMAAHKIYPDAVILFPGSQEKNVRNFLEKTGFPLPVRRLKNFDLSKIKKLVVVDTPSKKRIGVLSSLCGKSGVEIELYDHHPAEKSDITPTYSRVEPRGATSTLMVEILREREIALSPEEATLLMLGIYEDTGSLTFSSTCAEDFRAAEYLLKSGASLNIVSDFLLRNLNAEQVAVLHELLGNLEFRTINGVEIAIAYAKAERYIGDIAEVVHTLKDMENLSVLFVFMEMEGKVHFIARSRVSAVDASLVAAEFGGGGHSTAASATIQNRLINRAKTTLLAMLQKAIPPAPTAEQLMVSPIVSVKTDKTIEEAERVLTQFSFNALPVIEKEKVVGLITRQVIEKAIHHGLGKAKLFDYMQREIIQVARDSGYDIVKQIIINKKQKLLPVIESDGKVAGIIGRMDIINTIYSDFLKTPSSMLHPHRKISRAASKNLTGVIRERLPSKVHELLKKIEECAKDMGQTAYAVGGFVRDLLMRQKNLDIDIVIEGDGIEFAKRFVKKHGGRVKAHKKFKTAIMLLHGGWKIDVATARTEYYAEPAALPVVEMSSIKNDLYRRDFTINALAIKLNGKAKNMLIDFFGGQQDLKEGTVRVLHNLSFVEDPTRIFRAIRFEERFHFCLGSQTENLLKLAVKKELIGKVSGARLFNELQQIFMEEHLDRATKRIAHFGLWQSIHENLKYTEKTHSLIENAKGAIQWHRLTFDDEKIRRWLVYLFCLSRELSMEEAREMFLRLDFNDAPTEKFIKARGTVKHIAVRFDNHLPKSTVEVYEALKGLEPETLLTIMAALKNSYGKRVIADYMTRMRFVKPKVTGKELMKAGINEGPLLGKIIDVLIRENLKHALPTKKDETAFAKRFYKVLKENFHLACGGSSRTR